VPTQPAHHGDAGWEDRFSDPGRPKAASRRGEAPRGGAFLLSDRVWSAVPVSRAASVPIFGTSCSVWRDAGGWNHDAGASGLLCGQSYPQVGL